MAITKDKKQALVSELTELFANAKGTAVATYQGISVAELQELRKSAQQLIAEVVAQLLSPVHDVTNGLSGNLHALLDGVADKATA